MKNYYHYGEEAYNYQAATRQKARCTKAMQEVENINLDRVLKQICAKKQFLGLVEE